METIRGYEIIEELNKGSFCDAYKVRKDGKDYFLKIYKDPTSKSDNYKVFRENQNKMIPILNALGSQVEDIIEDFEVDGRYHQIKEFIPGATNLRVWMDGNDNYEDRLDVAKQFCMILQAIHRKGIIHQDLKPEQVMVVKNDFNKSGVKIILTDFDWSIPDGKMAQRVGTPWYGSIENKPTYKSDIFTFGIILCELLTGDHPYVLDEKGEERIFESTPWNDWVSNKEFTMPIRINTDLPPDINDAIVACLEPNPENRPSLDDILTALRGKPFPGKQVARKKAKLTAESGDQMIMVPGMGYGRKHFKELFVRTTDADSNEIYKYLDKDYAILSVIQEGEGLNICSPANDFSKNQMLLNGRVIPSSPIPVKSGDRVSIFSSIKGIEVAIFSIEII